MSGLEYDYWEDPDFLKETFNIDQITIRNFITEVEQDKTAKRVIIIDNAIKGYKKDKRFFLLENDNYPNLDGYDKDSKNGAVAFIQIGEEGE